MAKRQTSFIGVDFDKTLAHHRDGQRSLGTPIKPMERRVQRLLSEGKKVRVFTARPKKDHKRISDWTKEHIGKRLSVTNKKSGAMTKFYDDRAVGVKPNKGVRKSG